MEELAINEESVEINNFENEEKKIEVYVKVNEDGFIGDVNSSIFIKDFNGWIKIDEGFGDKFAHAQTHYFEKPIIDEYGKFNIKFENNRQY